MTTPLGIVPEDEGLWTVKDVARALKCSGSWVYKHLAEIPHIQLGAMIRFDPVAIRHWFRQRQAGPKPLTVTAIESVDTTSAKGPEGRKD